MKKLFMALMLCLVSIVGFSQITITSQGTKRTTDETYLYKGIYGNIRQIDTLYVICIYDLRSNDALYVHLGNSKETAIETLTILNDAFKLLKDREYIEFNDGCQDIVLYKWGGCPYFTNGTHEYIHNYLKNSTVQGLFGGNYQSSRTRENDAMVGCLDVASSFKKAIKKLSE